jgi:hypothetical protein
MIRHIVMFKLTETEPKSKKQEITARIKEKLEALSLKIPEVRFINIGVNINDSPNGFDMVLETEFDTIRDLETYRVHPEHRNVVDFINEYKVQSASVDYEV